MVTVCPKAVTSQEPVMSITAWAGAAKPRAVTATRSRATRAAIDTARSYPPRAGIVKRNDPPARNLTAAARACLSCRDADTDGRDPRPRALAAGAGVLLGTPRASRDRACRGPSPLADGPARGRAAPRRGVTRRRR